MSSLANPDVTVKVDDTAEAPYTDGSVIYIPAVDPQARDSKYGNPVIDAFVAVMVAHMQLCDFELFRASEVPTNLKRFWNTLENLRVMSTMRAEALTRLQLDSATRYLAANEAFALVLDDPTEADLMISFALGYGHSVLFNHECADSLYRESRTALVTTLGEDRVCHIERVLDEVPGLASTHQSLEIAQYLWEFLPH